jgi:DNA mismatch endonuclease, patch repair protein
MDVLTPRQRSHCMSRIRGKNTLPELALRAALWSLKLRYRLHYKIPGRPDIVFPSAKVAVFVDGCFWHGCPAHGVSPKSNSDFWRTKIGKNKARDKAVDLALKADGWTVLRFWEHDVADDVQEIADRIKLIVRGSRRTHPTRAPGHGCRLRSTRPDPGSIQNWNCQCSLSASPEYEAESSSLAWVAPLRSLLRLSSPRRCLCC